MRAALTALFGALALGLPGAQPSFRSGIDLVTVPVTVKHKDAARAVPEIVLGDLRVFENGTEQRIDFIERDTRPLSLTIVLDVSSSMVGKPEQSRTSSAAARRSMGRMGRGAGMASTGGASSNTGVDYDNS